MVKNVQLEHAARVVLESNPLKSGAQFYLEGMPHLMSNAVRVLLGNAPSQCDLGESAHLSGYNARVPVDNTPAGVPVADTPPMRELQCCVVESARLEHTALVESPPLKSGPQCCLGGMSHLKGYIARAQVGDIRTRVQVVATPQKLEVQ